MYRLFFFLSILPLLLSPTNLQAKKLVCANQPKVVVLLNEQEQLAEICSASQKAISFLARYNIFPTRPISFEVIEEPIDSRGYVAYGSYDSRSDRIRLMSYAAIMNGSEPPMMYGEPFDRVHYAGAIAHEVAHAVVQHNLKTKLLGTAPQEYLAHATQLAVMPEDRRNVIIQTMNIAAWESGDAISDIYMAIEPGKFAVKSYKHLLTMVDPEPFVQILLNAKWFYVSVP